MQFLYLAPVGLAQTTLSGDISMINPLSANLLMPLSRDGCLSNLFVVLEDVAPELRHLVANFGPTQGHICENLRIQVTAGLAGKSDPQILSLTLLKLNDKTLMAVLNDISVQAKLERQLSHQQSWFNAVLTGISDYALVSLDATGRMDEWNESIGRVTGWSADATLGQLYAMFYPIDAITIYMMADRLSDATNSGWSLYEGWCQKADGSQYWGSCMLVPVHGDNPKPGFCLVIRDISDKRDAYETQRKAMSCDYLTGIANRRTFFEAAEMELARWQRSPRNLSLVMFDADFFKAINDTNGHPAGDAVLRHLASLLTAMFRQVDVVARVGGEEFAVLLSTTDLQGAMAVADRLRQAVQAQAVEVNGIQIRYTVSGGVASMDDTVSGLDVLMKRADDALYAAKAGGRNRIERWIAPTLVNTNTDA